MTRQIYKFPLPSPGTANVISVSETCKPVHVDLQNGQPFCWIETETDDVWVRSFVLYCIGTGWDIPSPATHIGTLVDPAGFVWHYYMGRA